MSASRTKSKKMRQKTHRYTSNVFSMFNQAQIQEFKEAFNMIDQNRDGFVDKEDLIEMMTSLGKNPSDEFLDQMISEAPGPINFTMFLTLFGEKLNGTDPEDVIKNAFGCFDPKEIGYIDEEKLREYMMTMGDRWTNDMVDELFSTAPINSGNFEYNEFIHTLKHGNRKDEEEGAAAAANKRPQSPKPVENDVPPPTSKLAAAKDVDAKPRRAAKPGVGKDGAEKKGPAKPAMKNTPKPLKSAFKK